MKEYSKNGLELTKNFEGLSLKAYQDSVGVWTIGYGHTHGVASGQKCTQDQADAWLLEDVQDAVTTVNRLVLAPLTQNQFDACVDFVYNLGAGNFAKSTLLRLLNVKDYTGASRQFALWNRAGGQVLAGLARRRNEERRLFIETSL